MLHSKDLWYFGNTVLVAKELVTAPNKRTIVDTSNCLDTGATIFQSSKHTMKKMGLTAANLHKDQTRCSTADDSPLTILGFIPVKITVKDSEGMKHETNEYLYFAEGANTTLGCVPQHWPLPAAHVYRGKYL